jgi:hypothetical protein
MVTVSRWLQRKPKQVLFAMTALIGRYSSSVKNSEMQADQKTQRRGAKKSIG